MIDSDYQGEIKLSLFNRGKQPFIIKPKTRLAQMVFTRIMQPYFVEVKNFAEQTARGAGGFGSTGE